MWRYYCLLALRNALRNRLYAAIAVFGLALSLCASLFIALYVDDELSYDRWLPEHEQIHRVAPLLTNGNRIFGGPSDLGLWLRQDYPQIDEVTRLYNVTGVLSRDELQFNEQITWADANFFAVFQLPMLSGNPSLEQPDTLIISESMAQKYFADGDALGQTLLFDEEHPMRVLAIFADLPSNSTLNIDFVAPGHAQYSPLAEQDRNPVANYFGAKLWSPASYIKLSDSAQADAIEADLDAMMDRRLPVSQGRKNSEIYEIEILPLTSVHLAHSISTLGELDLSGIYTVATIGFLILLAATINYVNLMTARGLKRAPEIAIRKTVGANRETLFAQFIVESLLYVLVAFALALLLLLSLLPVFNGFLERSIELATIVQLPLLMTMAGILVLATLIAGTYPALVMSSYSPRAAFQANSQARSRGWLRQVLIVVQFAILTGLLIGSLTIYQQSRYGVREALSFTQDPVVLVTSPCDEPFKTALQQLPEVRRVACSWIVPQFGVGPQTSIARSGDTTQGSLLRFTSVDVGFFEAFDIPLVAGRYFEEERSTDVITSMADLEAITAIIINETLSRELGFDSPAEAIGQLLNWGRMYRLPTTFSPRHDVEIIGVLQDFQMGSVRQSIQPAGFYVQRDQGRLMALQVDGSRLTDALQNIDRIWESMDFQGPIERRFFDETVEQIYRNVTRQASLMTVYAAVAVAIALLGLVGLAAFVAEKRSKEIGIRKVLGGSRLDVIGLLLWQFSRPVLLSNLLAWPLAFYYLSLWLNGYERHIELSPWYFLAAGAVTLSLALLTVLMHALSIAGMNPVRALRYE